MNGQMYIREVLPADRSEWLRMLVALHGATSENDHASAIDRFFNGSSEGDLLPTIVFIAERDGGGAAGLLELSVRNYAEGCSGPTPYIEAWYVDQDVRQQGIGRALVAAAEQWAKQRGYREIASDALLENRASQLAHVASGFVEVERAVHFRKQLLP